VGKRLEENLHEQITNINICFDNISMALSKKRQALISELKEHCELEKTNIEKEKYKRKKRLDRLFEVYIDLKKADKTHDMDYQKVLYTLKRNQQRLNAIEDFTQDFYTKVLLFDENIQIQESGSIFTRGKTITDEEIAKEVRGKSVDTRISKDTLEDFGNFVKHPSFECNHSNAAKLSKFRRENEVLRESNHNSTSPLVFRNSAAKKTNLNHFGSNKKSLVLSYAKKHIRNGNNKIKKRDFLSKNNNSEFLNIKNNCSMFKVSESGLRKAASFFERERLSSNQMSQNQFTLDKKDNGMEKYAKAPMGKISEIPHTQRSQISNFEPVMIKKSKSSSRYANDL